MKLTSYVNAILCNIESNGLCRYDFNDLDKYIYEKYGIFKNNFYRKALRLLGIYFPISIRGLLGVQKSLNPAACYHLGMAYLSNERHDLGCRTPESAQEITQRAISNFYQEDSGLWLNPSGWVPLSEKSVRQKEGPRSMAMHYAARLNILLLELWKQYGREDLMEIAVCSAHATFHYHNVMEMEDGTAFISYYDNGLDNTPNVNSEYLEWVSCLPAARRSSELEELGHKILKMLICEQNADGSFYYLGKAYMAQYHFPPSIDSHHTAYILKNLAVIYASNLPTDEERKKLAQCLERGLAFYLDRLYHPDGSALCDLDHPKRKASAVPYSEGIVALCACLRSHAISEEQKSRIRVFLPKVMEQLLSTISLRDGSVPDEYLYGRVVNIDSIRWGNGPALQAIFEYMGAEKEGLLNP